MPILAADLPQTVIRQRETSRTTSQGDSRSDWTTFPPQAIRANVQPRGGQLRGLPEGLAAEVSDVLYCNFTTGVAAPPSPPNGYGIQAAGPPIAAGPPALVDIRAADRIVDAAGVKYRCLTGALDEGGQGDHYKVYLKTLGPTGD